MRPVECEEDGTITGFAYHDGHLDRVQCSEHGKRVALSLRDVDGEPRVVTLDGVVAFQMADFRQGNLVLSMSLFTPERAARDAEIAGMVRERLCLDAAALPAGTKVFALLPSYGADIVAVCKSVFVHEGSG